MTPDPLQEMSGTGSISGDPEQYYRTRYTANEHRREVWRHIASWLQRQQLVRSTDDVLELAAGYGDFITNIPARRRVAMDINPQLSRFVTDEVETVIGDCTDLSAFGDGSFDVIFASNFLEHLEWPNIDRCVDETRRVLRGSGRLLLLQPNFRLSSRRYFDDYTHRTIFTDRSICDYLTSRGFSVRCLEPRFLPLTMKSRLSVGHRLVPLYLALPWRPFAGQMLVSASPTSLEEGS